MERVTVEYPIGHRRRRAEGMPLLLEKFEASLRWIFLVEEFMGLLARVG